MRRKILIALFGLLVLGLCAGAVHWQLTADRLESGFHAWVAERRAQGWSVRTGAMGQGVWSRAVTLTIHDFEISGGEPAIPGGVGWQAPRLVLSVDPLVPWRLTVTPQGLQLLRLPDGTTVPVVAETVSITLEADSEPNRLLLALTASGVRAELPGGARGPEMLSIDAFEGSLDVMPSAGAGEKVAVFSVNGQTVRLPQGIRWPLGRTVGVIAAEGHVAGPLPDPAPPRLAATAWRDAGGSVEVLLQSLTWGPLTATGSATLALDDALQPMGAGTGHIVGYQGTFDALGSNGVLTHSAVKAAKALLSLMAGVPSGREPQSVDVPLTLQYRTLSMRQIPLALLPELEWPSP
jgi:hypothetical protein